jgi:hypothetical protein
MCRNIKTPFNFDPRVTEEEIRAAPLQLVRKVSGFNKASKVPQRCRRSSFHRVSVDRVHFRIPPGVGAPF